MDANEERSRRNLIATSVALSFAHLAGAKVCSGNFLIKAEGLERPEYILWFGFAALAWFVWRYWCFTGEKLFSFRTVMRTTIRNGSYQDFAEEYTGSVRYGDSFQWPLPESVGWFTVGFAMKEGVNLGKTVPVKINKFCWYLWYIPRCVAFLFNRKDFTEYVAPWILAVATIVITYLYPISFAGCG